MFKFIKNLLKDEMDVENIPRPEIKNGPNEEAFVFSFTLPDTGEVQARLKDITKEIEKYNNVICDTLYPVPIFVHFLTDELSDFVQSTLCNLAQQFQMNFLGGIWTVSLMPIGGGRYMRMQHVGGYTNFFLTANTELNEQGLWLNKKAIDFFGITNNCNTIIADNYYLAKF